MNSSETELIRVCFEWDLKICHLKTMVYLNYSDSEEHLSWNLLFFFFFFSFFSHQLFVFSFWSHGFSIKLPENIIFTFFTCKINFLRTNRVTVKFLSPGQRIPDLRRGRKKNWFKHFEKFSSKRNHQMRISILHISWRFLFPTVDLSKKTW